MANKRTGRKHLGDNVVNARRAAAARPQRVTIISGGMKYRPGEAPVRVTPAGGVDGAVRRVLGNPMLRKI